jgi:CelD/BcsL family acetyltransferase involved in cellulose biosynthesis
LASEGSLSLFFAQYQGKRIATLSCIDIQGRREAVMTGRDPEYADMSAGFLLFFETIIDAIDHGFHSYDFGMGWYAYKTRFTKTYIHTLNFFISPETSPIYLTKLFLGYECMISS